MFIFRAKRIFEGEQGLRFINGKLDEIFDPGLHFEFNLPFKQCRIDVVPHCEPLRTEYCKLPCLIDSPVIKSKIKKKEVKGDKSNKLYYNNIYIRDLPKGDYYFFSDIENKINIKESNKPTDKSAVINFDGIITKDNKKVAIDVHCEYQTKTDGLDFEEKEISGRITAHISKILLPHVGANDSSLILRCDTSLLNSIEAEIKKGCPDWLSITNIVITKTKEIVEIQQIQNEEKKEAE